MQNGDNPPNSDRNSTYFESFPQENSSDTMIHSDMGMMPNSAMQSHPQTNYQSDPHSRIIQPPKKPSSGGGILIAGFILLIIFHHPAVVIWDIIAFVVFRCATRNQRKLAKEFRHSASYMEYQKQNKEITTNFTSFPKANNQTQTQAQSQAQAQPQAQQFAAYMAPPVQNPMETPANIPFADQTKFDVYQQMGWLDRKTQTLNLNPKDPPITMNWVSTEIRKKITLWHSIKNTAFLMLMFALYAVLAYYFVELDNGETHLDNAFQAFFFPIIPYMLLSYRGLDKYLKALIISLALLQLVYAPLIEQHIITVRGIIFVDYFWGLVEEIPFLNIGDPFNMPPPLLVNNTLQVIAAIFVFEFIIMLISFIFQKSEKVEMVLTQQSIFIRAKTKKSLWENLKVVAWIAFNPFNVSYYKDLRDRVRYNQMTTAEGARYDFGRIPIDAVSSIEKKENKIGGTVFFAILLIIIGVPLTLMVVGVPILLIGIAILARALKGKKKFTVKILVNRSIVEGSWILSHTFNIFEFYRMDPSLARFFQPLKT